MNKKFLGVIAIAAIALTVALNVNLKSDEAGLSDLALSNVEALANKPPQCYMDKDCENYCNVYDTVYACPCGM